MKTRFLSILFLASLAGLLPAQSLKHALFLGNSYTYVNDLPALVSQIASSKGDSLFHAKYTPGGYTLELHSQDPTSRAAIKAAKWDYVILQEQSQLPSLWPDSVAIWTYPFADTLNRLIRENDSCTTTLFYMTWGRKFGDSQFCPVYPPVCTYEGMQARLRESYLYMGYTLTAEVSPVGAAWKTVRNQNPGIELYSSDNSHPSLNGSYLAACTFYAAIFHKSPVGGFVPVGISPGDAAILQQTASSTVLDSLGTWYIDTTSVQASFGYLPLQNHCFQFSNTSLNSSMYVWDFGDGNHSTLTNPQHCYSFPGSYTIRLFASDGCLLDSTQQQILITGTTESRKNPGLLIDPNPSVGKVRIVFPEALPREMITLTVCDTKGRLVYSGSIQSGGSVDLSGHVPGVYSIQVRSASSYATGKLLIKN
jgi:hypothetical protein